MVARHFFICPASDSLNKHNESGSIGQLSYLYLLYLAKHLGNASFLAVVMSSYDVEDFGSVKVSPIYRNSSAKNGLYSLWFYFYTYARYRFSATYRSSDIVYHLMPFAPGLSFNLFFIFKNKSKQHVIGPILGPHVNLSERSDEKPNWAVRLLTTGFSKVLSSLSKATIDGADVLIFPDEYARDSFNNYIQKSHRVLMIGFGVSPEFRKLSKAQSSLRDQEIRVLFVGRLTERKGCKYLIEAMRIAIKDHSVNVICNIVGTGPLRAQLEEQVGSAGLDGNINFHGSFDTNAEINTFYNQCDLVCLPVLSDTWMSAKEALWCGKPVVITDIASHGEHVIDGYNGFLVPPKDPGSIAKSIIAVSVDRKRLKKLSDNAYERAKESYSWDTIASTFIEGVFE